MRQGSGCQALEKELSELRTYLGEIREPEKAPVLTYFFGGGVILRNAYIFPYM